MIRRSGAGAVCLALTLAGCAATPPDEDPVQIKLKDVDARLGRIERVVANQSLLDLANQIEALRADVRALHNDVDVMNHGQDAARKQQHDLYVDLDQRLKLLEGRGGAGAGAGAATSAASPGAASSGEGSDKAAYQAAFDLLKASQYDRAIAAFQSFLATYPNSQLADNAQYWLGEAYYVNRSFPEALAAFQHLIESYPQSRKVADSLLKIGYCDYETRQYTSARDVLTQTVKRFPDTSAASLARQRLDKMAAENR